MRRQTCAHRVMKFPSRRPDGLPRPPRCRPVDLVVAVKEIPGPEYRSRPSPRKSPRRATPKGFARRSPPNAAALKSFRNLPRQVSEPVGLGTGSVFSGNRSSRPRHLYPARWNGSSLHPLEIGSNERQRGLFHSFRIPQVRNAKRPERSPPGRFAYGGASEGAPARRILPIRSAARLTFLGGTRKRWIGDAFLHLPADGSVRFRPVRGRACAAVADGLSLTSGIGAMHRGFFDQSEGSASGTAVDSTTFRSVEAVLRCAAIKKGGPFGPPSWR